jgi:hypothetical protein
MGLVGWINCMSILEAGLVETLSLFSVLDVMCKEFQRDWSNLINILYPLAEFHFVLVASSIESEADGWMLALYLQVAVNGEIRKNLGWPSLSLIAAESLWVALSVLKMEKIGYLWR